VRLSSHHTLEVPNYGRSMSDQAWEAIASQHISTWESALVTLKNRRLKVSDCLIDIECDWSPILKKHQQYFAVMQRLKVALLNEEKPHSILSEFPQGKAKISFTATVVDGPSNLANGSHINLAQSAIESHLHDCFLILNICAPGCCDFYHAELLKGFDSSNEISLSNIHFEVALLGSLNKEWPSIGSLPLGEVVRWFYSIRDGVGQLPKNRMEKAIFALLHISKLDMSPMIVIWLFYAFESLLQTKVGENYSSMISRISSLLELTEKQSKILRSKLRSLYDARSAIVHGGFEVSHPMHNEILDERVDQNFQTLSDATGYALTLLIAGIQTIISRGWRYPSFSEKIEGVPIVD
jgi:Apea-like HEPN